MKRLLIASFCLLCLLSPVSAQEARFFLNQDTLSLDEELEVNVLIVGVRQPSTPDFPQINGFEKKSLRSRRERTNRGVETVFSQTYRPNGEPGTYRLNGFEVRVGGDRYLFPARNLTVQESEFVRENYLEEEVDAFLDFRLNKSRCFVGEQVVAEAVLFVNAADASKIRLNQEEMTAFDLRINNPDFWEERVENPDRFTRERKIGNKTYLAYQLYKGFLFPLKPGEFPFTEVYAEAEKRMVSKWATDFEVEIDKRVRFKPVVYRAAPRSLNVLPLPEPQMTQSVGDFRMEAHLAPRQVATGQPIELLVRISGDGNVPLIPAPAVHDRETFRQLEPVSSYQIQKSDSVMRGHKEFMFKLIPAYAGDQEVGPVIFTYFNPRQAAYDSLIVAALAVTVTGEDQPQLLQESRLDGFYRLAFDHAVSTPRFSLPFADVLAAALGLLALVFMVWGIWREKRLHYKGSIFDQKDALLSEKERAIWESINR